ncbi:MAG: nicotinate (nicotinamide) nucleotide adenylyltransferase [Rhodothermales bacterium]
MQERVGVFGGTFDPPHRAHLHVALTACEALNLDRLLWIPAGTPPHKEAEEITEPRHRLEMTRLMTQEGPLFMLDRGEINHPGPSWTVTTLERLSKEHPAWELILIMGEDQWAAFDTWHRPEDILKLARVAVYHRAAPMSSNDASDTSASDGAGPDTDKRHERSMTEPDYWLPGSHMAHTSSGIRKALSRGESVDHLLLPSVASYIHKHHLYGPIRSA